MIAVTIIPKIFSLKENLAGEVIRQFRLEQQEDCCIKIKKKNCKRCPE